MSKIIASFVEVQMRPMARCMTNGCDWEVYGASAKECKDHVRETGHSVERKKLTVGSYYPEGKED